MSLNYETTNWENGKTVLKAEHLRKIEKGITDIISENDAIYTDEDIRKSNEKQRQEEHSRKMDEVSGVVSDIQKDYDSLQKIIIDENASANLQNQINSVNSQLEHKENYITYEEFGAKCDGVYDDGIAIKLAHEYANLRNLKVIAKSKTYYIKETSNIEIQTNTDFNGATFVIDDTLELDRTEPIFRVVSKYNTISMKNPNFTINRKTKVLSELAGYGNCFVEVVNQNKRQYIRKGANADNGDYQRDYFIIDNKGMLLNEVVWDFEDITEITLYPIDDSFLIINNGNFITKVNNKETEYKYYERGFIVNRSNVIFDNINHKLDFEIAGSPYNGFIHGVLCANLYIKNCMLQSHIAYKNSSNTTMGTYDLRFDKVVNLRLDNVIDRSFDTDRWGIFTSNHCKDVIVEKCKLTRVDAHKGVHNIKIKDCTLGHQSIQLIGSGICKIEDVDIYNAPTIVTLRGDYGSTWEGDMVIKNVKLYCGAIDYTPKLVDFGNDGTHYFGYDCYYPKKLVLEDIYVDDSKVSESGSYTNMFIIYNGSPKTGVIDNSYKYPYNFSKHIECRNLRTETNKGFMVFFMNTLNMYSDTEFYYEELEKLNDNSKILNIIPNTTIILDNIQLTDFTNGATYSTSNIFRYMIDVNAYTDNYLDNQNRVLTELVIKNCKNIFGYTGDNPIVLKLEDCIINHLTNKDKSVRMIGKATNCLFQPRLSEIGSSLNTNWGSFEFINCYFDEVKVNGIIETNIDNIIKAYAFLSYFKVTGNRYIHAKVRMSNCNIFNLDFNLIHEHIKYCNFKFGNHNFEYYLSSYGYDGEKPRPSDCNIPVGFTYWVTSLSKFITWNGTEWI